MSDQMYLKCVSSIANRTFTEGQVYPVKSQTEQGYLVVTNNENTLEVPLDGGVWKFEVVQGSSKLTPRSLGCFQEVADVIGETGAEVELQKVIDCSKDLIGEDADKSLIDCFTWSSTPQQERFWSDVFEGNIPDELHTKAQPESTPVFGDVLHVDGKRCVYIACDEDGDHHVTFENGSSQYIYELHEFDEYAPDETQELRNQILKDWQQQSLNNSFDTEVCRVDMSVGDIISFILENGYRKSEGNSLESVDTRPRKV